MSLLISHNPILLQITLLVIISTSYIEQHLELDMTPPERIRIHYFTDILCVWAYLAQIRLDELIKHHSSQVDISYNFTSIFGDTENRIGKGWKDKGGFDGFSKHTHEVCKGYPHVELHKDIWAVNTPKTSTTSHVFLKAVQYLVDHNMISNERNPIFEQRTAFEELIWQVRLAFFRDLKDISQVSILMDIAKSLDLPIHEIKTVLDDGSALAKFSRDLELKDEFSIEGSPTYVLNKGRQKLYGNVGYRIIDANLQEILNQPSDIEASWC